MIGTCAVDGCGDDVAKRDWCNKHYIRWRRYGDPLGAAPTVSMEDRFWQYVNKDGPVHPDVGTPCWIWTASTFESGGYGAFFVAAKNGPVRANKHCYEMLVGPIPDGLVLDHMCETPACVRPDHLRAVTNKQNTEHIRSAAIHSQSGVRGVYWHSQRRKWRGQLMHNRKSIHVGLFDTIAEADLAVTAKRLELFTHSDNR